MSSIQCCVSGCKLKPEYLCSCTNPESVVCLTHLNSHGDSGLFSHSFKNIFCRPLEDTKITLLAHLRQEKKKINAMKLKFISEDSTNIQNMEDILKNKIKALTSGIKAIDYYIVTIMATNEVERSSDDSLLKLLLLSPSEALLQVDQAIKDNIDFGSIADNCCSKLGHDEVNPVSLETIQKINKLEIEVKELREKVASLSELSEEVKSLREIIRIQIIQQSSNIENTKNFEKKEESKEIASETRNFSQELQSHMLSFSGNTPFITRAQGLWRHVFYKFCYASPLQL